MIKSQNKPIFITGVPRSGTTWIANILGSAKGVRLLSEPDNEKYSFIGRIWKKSLHRQWKSPFIKPRCSALIFGRLTHNRFHKCISPARKFSYRSSANLWKSASYWSFGCNRRLQCAALFQFCTWRNHGFWDHDHHSLHVGTTIN